jgi:hypothetical protein
MNKPSKHKEWYWGHPDAEPIDSREYAGETQEVFEVLQINQDHPGIQTAITEIDRWLEDAYESKYFHHGWLLERLWSIGIRGPDVIQEASALLLFCIRNPNRFIDDNHYIHVLGNKIIRIVPYWGQTRGYEHSGIGASVQKKIGGVDLAICRSVIQGQKKARQIKHDMSVPLEI